MDQKTSIFSNGLIWFGAAVSIAEILTGTYYASMGIKKALLAIIIGHVIGCILLYLAGIIGAKTGKCAMDTVKLSFGSKGTLFFSSLNVLQLVGWTAVMIVSGAGAANAVVSITKNEKLSTGIWCAVIGILIIVWVLIGLKSLSVVNTIAMGLLFILTVILSITIFKDNTPAALTDEPLTFGAAVELSVAMPLSWLPLISDYTRMAKKPKMSTFVSVIVYFAVSCWMYFIGMGAAYYTGQSDIAGIMVKAGLGIAALVIIIFSTVTTTFLDVYSAGISSQSISEKLKSKGAAIVVCVIGTIMAALIPISRFESFLYLIGSVFTPMIAILISDYFILKKDHSQDTFNLSNILIWLCGFIVYRLFMRIDIPLGSTFPVILITVCLSICVWLLTEKIKKNKKA